MSNLKEAELVYESGYYRCPVCVDAIYHTYSFTHRRFVCKDCNQEFLVPEHIKLNKDDQFVKRKPRVGSDEPQRKPKQGANHG